MHERALPIRRCGKKVQRLQKPIEVLTGPAKELQCIKCCVVSGSMLPFLNHLHVADEG